MNSEDNNKTISWAKRRQIIILSVISILIIIVIGASLYSLLHKPPTCFDNHKNQNETGIDCGGVCTKICANDISALKVDWVRLFKIRDGLYSVVAKVENPSTDSIAENTPYTFSLKDSSGKVIATKSGKTFIPSRSSFIVFEGSILVKGEAQSVNFNFDSVPNWQKSDYQAPNVNISNKQLTNVDTSPVLVADVTNPGIIAINNITLDALIYDDQGNAVQVSQTYIETIPAGSTVKATFTWPQPISLKSRVCESPVDTALVLDRSGSMEYLGLNPQQPFTDVKNAADSFVSELTSPDQVSVVSFANTASSPIDTTLISDFVQAKKIIDGIFITQPAATQDTNIGDGLEKATDELTSTRHNKNSGLTMILLTDGVADRPLKKGDVNYPEEYAISVANQAKSDGIRIFTIGLGKNLNQDFLKKIATSPDDFYLAPTASQLQNIYTQIGTKMCTRKPTTLDVIPSIPLQ